MTTDWIEVLRRSRTSLDRVAEALYEADGLGSDRYAHPSWVAVDDDTRMRWRRLARVAVSALAPLENSLLERLIDSEALWREQNALQAKKIRELERKVNQ